MTTSGRHHGDHCRTSILRCSDGVQGGAPSGNTGSDSPLAGGRQPTADSGGDWVVAGDGAQVSVGGERGGACPGWSGAQRGAVEPAGWDQPGWATSSGDAGGGQPGSVGRPDLPVADRRPVEDDAGAGVAGSARVYGVVHVVASVHQEAKLGTAQYPHGAGGRHRSRRGGRGGLRPAGNDHRSGHGQAQGGVGADHRAVVLAALFRLADAQPKAGGCDRRPGSGVGVFRRRAPLPGHRQFPRGGGRTGPVASAPDPRLSGIFPASLLRRRPSAGASSQRQAQGGTQRVLRPGASLQGR